ncbi:hypothetical protein ACFV1C_41045 [Streptomyces sp. NPDC059605]|uniref:hypothetical protein n=1 Tax=unclassified Streptomyces TaxID=2593676 RepID=UPI0036944FF0
MARKAIGRVVALAVALVLVWFGWLFLFDEEEEPFVTYGYQSMCKEPQEFSQAAPRSDKGPRPVAIDNYWLDSDSDSDSNGMTAADLRVWNPTKPETVQLVACVERTGRGEQVKRCVYQTMPDVIGGTGSGETRQHPFSLYLYKGIYKVTLYEAATGKRLGGTEIHGERFQSDDPNGSAADPCPPRTIAPKPGEDDEEESEPTPDQLREFLDPYVLD